MLVVGIYIITMLFLFPKYDINQTVFMLIFGVGCIVLRPIIDRLEKRLKLHK